MSKVITLPAQPALELCCTPAKMAQAIVVRPTGPAYALPGGYGNADLTRPKEPPASLGQFWPK